jgi:hypothetical protein
MTTTTNKFLTIDDTNDLLMDNNEVITDLMTEVMTELDINSNNGSSSYSNSNTEAYNEINLANNTENTETNMVCNSKSKSKSESKSESKSKKSNSKGESCDNIGNAEQTTTKITTKLTKLYDFTIKPDIFTEKELMQKPENVFVRYSKVKNSELIKYLLVKHKIIPYKCSGKSCPTQKTNMWRRKPVYLFLVHKNGIAEDCRVTNLLLMCPNCYCLEYGPQSFNREVSLIVKKCMGCDYIIKGDIAKYTKYCKFCNGKIKEISKNYTCHDIKTDEEMNDYNLINSLTSEFMTNIQNNNIQQLDLLSDYNTLIYDTSEDNVFDTFDLNKESFIKNTTKAANIEKRQKNTKSNTPNYNHKVHTNTVQLGTEKTLQINNGNEINLNLSNLADLDEMLNAL